MNEEFVRVQSRSEIQRQGSAKGMKTFSSCKTCRFRHLKCDEARPWCLRCTSAKLRCSGYPGYRATVHWRPVKGPSNYGNTLRSHSHPHLFVNSAASNASPSESEEPIPFIESPILDGMTPTPARYDEKDASIEAESISSQIVIDCVDNLCSERTSKSSSSLMPKELSATTVDWQDTSIRNLASLFEYSSEGMRASQVGKGDSLDAYGSNHSQFNTSGLLRSCASSHNLEHCNPPILSPSSRLEALNSPDYRTSGVGDRHLDRLPQMDRQRQLVEYWVDHLSDALAAVPGSRNPLKSILIPIAYEGASSPAHEITGSVALFHLICAAAAFHLSSHSSANIERSDLMTLALSHHSQGIHHLQRNLTSDDLDQRESILASLLVCLYYEPVTVEATFWRTHLQGAAHWLRQTDMTGLQQSESATILYQMLVGSAIFLRSQMMSDEMAHGEDYPYDMNVISDPYFLDQIFGVSKQSLQAISNIIEMVAKERRHLRTGCNPCGLRSSLLLNQMELELYLSMPKTSPYAATNKEDILIHHYLYIFYFASLIYFKRVLRNAPLEEVQSLVEQSLDHIEALKDCTSRPFSPFVWPIAITCFEAKNIVLQRRATAWLDFIIIQSTLSIWPKAKSLIRTLWTRRAGSGDADLQWDAFLNEPLTPSIMMV